MIWKYALCLWQRKNRTTKRTKHDKRTSNRTNLKYPTRCLAKSVFQLGAPCAFCQSPGSRSLVTGHNLIMSSIDHTTKNDFKEAKEPVWHECSHGRLLESALPRTVCGQCQQWRRIYSALTLDKMETLNFLRALPWAETDRNALVNTAMSPDPNHRALTNRIICTAHCAPHAKFSTQAVQTLGSTRFPHLKTQNLHRTQKHSRMSHNHSTSTEPRPQTQTSS